MAHRDTAVDLAVMNEKRETTCKKEVDEALSKHGCQLAAGVLLRPGKYPEPIMQMIKKVNGQALVLPSGVQTNDQKSLDTCNDEVKEILRRWGCVMDFAVLVQGGKMPQVIVKIVINPKVLIPPAFVGATA